MNRAITEPCQMRIGTDHPCPRPAAMEFRSVPFCESCAREQEAYFAIGELTQKLASVRTKQLRGSRDGLLAGALYRLQTNPATREAAVKKGLVETARW